MFSGLWKKKKCTGEVGDLGDIVNIASIAMHKKNLHI